MFFYTTLYKPALEGTQPAIKYVAKQHVPKDEHSPASNAVYECLELTSTST